MTSDAQAKGTVLIIDDAQIVRDEAESALRDAGYTVITTSSIIASEALKALGLERKFEQDLKKREGGMLTRAIDKHGGGLIAGSYIVPAKGALPTNIICCLDNFLGAGQPMGHELLLQLQALRQAEYVDARLLHMQHKAKNPDIPDINISYLAHFDPDRQILSISSQRMNGVENFKKPSDSLMDEAEYKHAIHNWAQELVSKVDEQFSALSKEHGQGKKNSGQGR